MARGEAIRATTQASRREIPLKNGLIRASGGTGRKLPKKSTYNVTRHCHGC